MGARIGAIKLAMAGTQDWWRRFNSSIVGLLILRMWLERAESLITKR